MAKLLESSPALPTSHSFPDSVPTDIALSKATSDHLVAPEPMTWLVISSLPETLPQLL